MYFLFFLRLFILFYMICAQYEIVQRCALSKDVQFNSIAIRICKDSRRDVELCAYAVGEKACVDDDQRYAYPAAQNKAREHHGDARKE